MHDRGMIKWAPFASVLSGSQVLREIEEEKSRIVKPILSPEQTEELEQKIIECFNNSTLVEVLFYQQYHIHKITGVITKINVSAKNITINGHKTLFFTNIMRIKQKNT